LGTRSNAKARSSETPLDAASELKDTRTANLRWKHGGKTSEELKAEGK
jgi:hypothetical protein